MNEILISLATTLINNFAPVIITAMSGWIAVKYNSFLNTKQEQLKANIKNEAIAFAVTDSMSKLQLTQEILDFVNKKATEAVYVAAEEAFKSWKDNSTKEMTGDEKKDVAVSFVEEAVKTVTTDKNILNLIPSIIEKAVSFNRKEIDNVYESLKQNFVLLTGAVPANSRNPFPSTIPNVTPNNF